MRLRVRALIFVARILTRLVDSRSYPYPHPSVNVKREHDSGQENYVSPNPNYSPTRDPRIRARIGGFERFVLVLGLILMRMIWSRTRGAGAGYVHCCPACREMY
ncbi:hypothetical protein DFH07DRAFT_272912 [Mycena maculata]|uniref:Secreted protein n=1 Tax=Mycena maculata TaxID=230809 RepID=A0AAD7JS03_9AGAR|nr:hypothetical protein DFH07DRAFT_272912 [Mycena maculata]